MTKWQSLVKIAGNVSDILLPIFLISTIVCFALWAYFPEENYVTDREMIMVTFILALVAPSRSRK